MNNSFETITEMAKIRTALPRNHKNLTENRTSQNDAL